MSSMQGLRRSSHWVSRVSPVVVAALLGGVLKYPHGKPRKTSTFSGTGGTLAANSVRGRVAGAAAAGGPCGACGSELAGGGDSDSPRGVAFRNRRRRQVFQY